MELAVFLDQILFVIVLYKRKPEDSPAFNALQTLGEKEKCSLSIFLYDNSPEPAEVHLSPVFYRHDPENNGVSKAYNEAAFYAEGLKKKWMLLLDQDTYRIDEFVLKLPEAIQENSESLAFVPVLVDEYSPVSPFRWSWGRGIRTKVTLTKLLLKKFRFLNSGLFIKREAFQNVYGYPESIPLYFSDIAFGERLQMATDHFVVVQTELHHCFSASEKIPTDAALHRYHYFCIGAFGMGEAYGPYLLYYIRAFLRGLKLSVKFKHAGFLKVFYLIAKW